MKRFFVVFLFSFLLLHFSSGQQYNFKTFSIENGLPQNAVYSITQDSKGFIWVGTNGGGACRFDGRVFKTFNKKNGLAGNVVRRIIEDSGGNMWFATDEGLSVYNGYDFFTLNKNTGLSDNVFISVYEDNKGNIWAGTNEGGVNKITFKNSDDFDIQIFNTDNGLAYNMVFDIIEDRYQRVWVATFSRGIDIISFEKDTFFIDNIRSVVHIPSDHILKLEEAEDKNIWIASYNEGAFKYCISGADSGKVVNNILSDNTVWDICSIDNDNIWLATNQNGIYQYNGKTFENFVEETGFPNNQVLSLYSDNEGNLWSGTMGSGLSMYQGKEIVHYSEKDGLTKNQIFDIQEDKNGTKWLATYGGGLLKCTLNNDSVTVKQFTKEEGLQSNFINSIAIDQNNEVWMASSNQGIIHYNGKEFINYNIYSGLINNEVNCIYHDSRDLIWCGTIGGISMFDGESFISINKNSHGLINDEVQTIMEDSEGLIWFGTLGGMAYTNGKTMTDYDETDGLIDKKIWCLEEDVQGNIWIGTFGGGIYKLIKNTEDTIPVKFIADDKLLSSNNIHSLLFENDSTLIVCTNKGFDRVFLNNSMNIKSVKHFDGNNGFSPVETKQNAIYKDSDNKIWIGTVKGFSIYNPMESKNTITKPITNITGLKLFFEETDWSEYADSIIPHSKLPYNLNLKHFNNHLTFVFTGISYSNPVEIKYQYKLEGLEEEWSPIRKENEAVYSGLPAGDFTFKVRSISNDGILSDSAEFSFSIAPPFWKTTWFISLSIIVVIILFITFIKLRERKLIRDKKILEDTVKQRTAEIEQQKEEIEAQRDEIEDQRNQIEEQLSLTSQQRDLIAGQRQEIVDSIKYAQRIQKAILPRIESVSKNFPEHFVLFKPKDIVSGDFYWSTHKNDELIICAADCTGHGVPGAFMSMLGVSFLNQIITEKGATKPSEILNLLRVEVINALQQKGDEGEAKDGMDIAMCTVNLKQKTIQYSGANNPLYIVSKTENKELEKQSNQVSDINNVKLYEVKADKMPGAIHIRIDEFTNHNLTTKQGDT
ncbi:MAG: hypothetical protein C0594_12900, partial [Marinilabiliales bacterium]